MNVFFSIAEISIGLLCLLSSYYQWTWWWRLSGVGNYLHNRFGPDATRFVYGFTGVLLISEVAKEVVASILSTNLGRLSVLTLSSLIVGFIFITISHQRTKVAEIKLRTETDKNNPQNPDNRPDNV